MHLFADRVAESSTTTGTGPLTLGGALTGARTFASAVIQGIFLFPYLAEAVDANGVPTGEWECGLGELSSATTVERRFVLSSSNAGSLVNFSAGTKYVTLAVNAFSSPVGLIRSRQLFYETDFLGPASAGAVEAAFPWDLSLVSSGTQSKIAGEANHPGILRLSSSTTANSGVAIVTDAPSVGAFLISGGEISQHIFRIQTLTNTTIRMAFLDTASSTDATDGVYIEIPATGAAVGKTASNSTRTTSSTIATLSTNTWYKAVVAVNHNATNCWFGIYSESGSLLGSQTISTNIPTGAGRQTNHGVVATNSGTTAVALIELDYMSVGVLRPLTR